MSAPIKIHYVEKFKGHMIREFSEEVHGEEFKKLAEEFRVTNNGSILKEGDYVPSNEVPKAGEPKRIIANKRAVQPLAPTE